MAPIAGLDLVRDASGSCCARGQPAQSSGAAYTVMARGCAIRPAGIAAVQARRRAGLGGVCCAARSRRPRRTAATRPRSRFFRTAPRTRLVGAPLAGRATGDPARRGRSAALGCVVVRRGLPPHRRVTGFATARRATWLAELLLEPCRAGRWRCVNAFGTGRRRQARARLRRRRWSASTSARSRCCGRCRRTTSAIRRCARRGARADRRAGRQAARRLRRGGRGDLRPREPRRTLTRAAGTGRASAPAASWPRRRCRCPPTRRSSTGGWSHGMWTCDRSCSAAARCASRRAV